MTASRAWQKSSFSGTQGECVELAAADDAVKLRESDESHTVLTTNRTRLGALLTHVKAGRLDHIALDPGSAG